MPYKWATNPGLNAATGAIQAAQGRNRVARAGRKAGKMANMIDKGMAERLGILADGNLGATMQSIDALSVDSALANSPEQQQAMREQMKRQARQDYGIQKVNQVNSLYMGLRGMALGAQESFMNRDVALANALAQANLGGHQGYQEQSAWEKALGYAIGGASAVFGSKGIRG